MLGGCGSAVLDLRRRLVALSQLGLFWIAPIAGAVVTGWLHRAVFEARPEPEIVGRA